MVVVKGGCPKPCKKGRGNVRAGELSEQGYARGNMSRADVRIPSVHKAYITEYSSFSLAFAYKLVKTFPYFSMNLDII